MIFRMFYYANIINVMRTIIKLRKDAFLDIQKDNILIDWIEYNIIELSIDKTNDIILENTISKIKKIISHNDINYNILYDKYSGFLDIWYN